MEGNSITQRVRELIEKKDSLFKLFGMKVTECTAGNSTVTMKVDKTHLNAAEICHGGTIFSLADVAFALASNSHGQVALAIDMSISYLRPAKAGDLINKLVALLKATSFITESNHFKQ